MQNETNIEITLKEKSDYQNKFNKKILSTELSNYIYEECLGNPLTNTIKLTIYPWPSMTKYDQEELIDQIRRNYGMMIQEEELHLKYSSFFKTIVFLFGVIAIIVSYLLEQIHGYITSEVVLILAWVMIWEPIYHHFFEDQKRKIKIKRLKKLTTCQIDFLEGEQNERSKKK